jgi:hypothetical protein
MTKPRLTVAEKLALQRVLSGIKTGLITERKGYTGAALTKIGGDDAPLNKKLLFNMGEPGERIECGTVACIGGWMGIFMGMTIPQASDFVESKEDRPNKFRTLFYPDHEDRINVAYPDITTKQAAAAIENFLRTGKPNWNRVLKTVK